MTWMMLDHNPVTRMLTTSTELSRKTKEIVTMMLKLMKRFGYGQYGLMALLSLGVVAIWGSGTTYAVSSMQPGAVNNYDDIEIGSESVWYVDPEFDSENNRISYRDSWILDGEVWVGSLNPEDGTLITDTVIWLDDHLSPILTYDGNGPEWMRDNGADKVIYTRDEGDGLHRMYLWSTETELSQPIGPEDGINRFHFAGTKSPDGPGKVLYKRRLFPSGDWGIFWLDLSNPTQEFHIPNVELAVSLPTWIDSDHVLYSKLHDDGRIQLAHYDTATHTQTVLTTDDGDKLGAYAWHAPEVGGQLLYMAAVRFEGNEYATEVRIYQGLEGASAATLFTTLAAREITRQEMNILSPEPFVYDGRSYISLSLAPDEFTVTSVWVFSLPDGAGGDPLPPQRVDNPNLRVKKLDPEVYVTPYGAFIYYYYTEYYEFPNARVILRRCRFQPDRAGS